jgi:hypothetical protein
VFILANSVWSRSDSKLPWAADQSLPEPALLPLVLEGIFGAMFSNRAEALLEAQDWAWNTVFWGFCFALVLGVGSRPYLWRGQTAPGSSEDLDAPLARPAPGRR